MSGRRRRREICIGSITNLVFRHEGSPESALHDINFVPVFEPGQCRVESRRGASERDFLTPIGSDGSRHVLLLYGLEFLLQFTAEPSMNGGGELGVCAWGLIAPLRV